MAAGKPYDLPDGVIIIADLIADRFNKRNKLFVDQQDIVFSVECGTVEQAEKSINYLKALI